MEKPPCVELGKPLNWCARALRDQQIEGRTYLPAEGWNGWRIVQDRIIGPRGINVRRRTLQALWRPDGMPERRKQRAS